MNFNRLHIPALLFAFFLATVTLSSCKKESTIIYAPAACFIADKLEIELGESITFENCSVAETTFIYVLEEDEEHDGTVYSFNDENEYSHTFTQAGMYIVTVRASNSQPGSPVVNFERVITVNP